MEVGSIVQLNKAMLGNDKGTYGICYEEYRIGSVEGCSFIFENGKYDGFSPVEQNSYLDEVIGIDGSPVKGIDFHYEFSHVIQLNRDWNIWMREYLRLMIENINNWRKLKLLIQEHE